MFDRFLEQSYYEFPSFEVALYSLLLSFFLSTIIAFTYRLTVKKQIFSNNFFQAIVLSSMVSSMVIMAVGDSLAVGFGIIGAIAIIRFRTRMQNPRNIIFIFASLSVGIATGVYGYSIAIAGTGVFCLVAFLLFFSPYGKTKDFEYELTLNIEDNFDDTELNRKMETAVIDIQKTDLRGTSEATNRVRYIFFLAEGFTINDVQKRLRDIAGITDMRITKNRNQVQL